MDTAQVIQQLNTIRENLHRALTDSEEALARLRDHLMSSPTDQGASDAFDKGSGDFQDDIPSYEPPPAAVQGGPAGPRPAPASVVCPHGCGRMVFAQLSKKGGTYYTQTPNRTDFHNCPNDPRNRR